MKRILGAVLFFCLFFLLLFFLSPKEKEKYDENLLYKRQFENTFLKFERYDFVLGGRMIVGVEKSTNYGKNYTKVTEEPVIVSNEAKFLFITEKLGFIISTGSIEKDKNFTGFKVTQDGGVTFVDAKFTYTNERINLISIEDFPYYEGEYLKLNCSIYDIKEDKTGYEDVYFSFYSKDNGMHWSLDKV